LCGVAIIKINIFDFIKAPLEFMPFTPFIWYFQKLAARGRGVLIPNKLIVLPSFIRKGTRRVSWCPRDRDFFLSHAALGVFAIDLLEKLCTLRKTISVFFFLQLLLPREF